MQAKPYSTAPTTEWKKFFRRCVSQRIHSAEFKDVFDLMMRRHPVSGKKLVDAVLEARAVTNVEWDPLIPIYVDHIHRLADTRTSDVLSSLLSHSTISNHHDSQQKRSGDTGQYGQVQNSKTLDTKGSAEVSTFMTDYRIIQNLMMAVTSGHGPISAMGILGTFSVIAEWILALTSWNPQIGEEKDQSQGLMGSNDAISIFESIGFLFVALMSSEKSAGALSSLKPGGQRTKLARALSTYIPFCAQFSMPLRARLGAIQKEFDLFTKESRKADQENMMEDSNVSIMEFESSIVNGPDISSRAGLYIYINAMLAGRPLADDSVLMNYLNNRYGGHHISLVEELITASFDVLSNGMYRSESTRTMFLFRAFLVNKLPPFFAQLSASLVEPIPMELCITRALSRVDRNTFPSFSEIFAMQGNSVLSDVRQEFLFSCALHKLIPESSIERLLGENPMQTLPVGGQYVKHSLVAQISNNPERAEQLLNGIESMDGNAGAIVEAIADTIHNLASRKDSMALKNICNSLARRPQALDIMLLFRSPSTILQPLCALLDAWKWDEDQGECQPVYDEFGSILLLVLAFKYKYGLCYHDLGVSNADSFVFRLLERGASSQRLEDLTEKQSHNLGAWVTALFIAEGISDESMSSCSPQEFYLLVSTLFNQSLEACETGKLEFDTLKGGFDYLLEPFLLPSLVMALSWLAKHIWEYDADLTTSLKILHALVKPSSISGEAQEIHRTVLFITSETLEDELKAARNRYPDRQDIKPILDALEPYQSFQRTGATQRSELDNWRNNSAGGGMITSIRNTFSSLILWSSTQEISMTPPSYTHRQILAGIRHLGAVRVLNGLIDELKLQNETGSGEFAIDIAATLICAPMAESLAAEQMACRANDDMAKEAMSRCPILTLRDALDLQRESLAKTIETDAHRAEVIVRLNRRVAALSSVPQMGSGVGNLDVGNIMQGISLDGVDGGEHMDLDEAGSDQRHQKQGEGTGQTPGNLDAMLDAAASATVGGTSADNGVNLSPTHDMDAGVFDDVLGDMGVGHPEFIDLDMEGMF